MDTQESTCFDFTNEHYLSPELQASPNPNRIHCASEPAIISPSSTMDDIRIPRFDIEDSNYMTRTPLAIPLEVDVSTLETVHCSEEAAPLEVSLQDVLVD